MTDLRPWQQNARRLIAELLRAGSSDRVTALIEAGIGSGKTLAALIAASDAIESKQIGRIIVVTYTAHLVRQWGKVATLLGLNLLECRGGNGSLKDGFPLDAKGYITTFAAVASMSALHQAHAASLRTLIIIDEIHHLGEDEEGEHSSAEMTKWATEADAAFKNSAMIVALSGTPYRTDKKYIPFVEYDPHPYRDMYLLKSDLKYSYGQSVFDGICRRVMFETLDGPVTFNILLEKNGQLSGPQETRTLHFNDKMEPEHYHERLTAALKIDNEYNPSKCKNQLLIDLIRKANNRLQDLRATDPRAGALLIAHNKEHARKLRVLLKQVTGYDAILVLDDVPQAGDLIDAYRDGDSPWIVAVNMVAEGVDIPRLRVCVYLSSRTAWLYVMQVIGRIVRDPPGQSYFYCYPDPRLLKIIEQIEEELEVWLRRKKDGEAPPSPEFKRVIELDKALGDQWAGLVAGEPVTATEMQAVDVMRHSMPELGDADYLMLLQMARKTKAAKQQQEHTRAAVTPTGMSYTESRIDLRQRIQKAVGRLNKIRPDLAHNDIHNMLNKEAGVRGKDAASVEQLQHMLALVQEWIATLGPNNGDTEQS